MGSNLGKTKKQTNLQTQKLKNKQTNKNNKQIKEPTKTKSMKYSENLLHI